MPLLLFYGDIQLAFVVVFPASDRQNSSHGIPPIIIMHAASTNISSRISIVIKPSPAVYPRARNENVLSAEICRIKPQKFPSIRNKEEFS